MNSFKSKWLPILLPEKGRGWLIVIAVHMAITGAIGLMLPSLTENFYNDFKNGNTAFYYLAGLFIAEYVNRVGYQISVYRFVQELLVQTRSKTFGLWMKAPLKVKRKGMEDEFPLGEVLARVMTDSDSVKELVTSGAFAIVIDFIFILSSLIGFLRLNAGVGIGLFALEVIACVLLVWGSRKMGVVFTEVRKVTGLLSRVVADVTKGLRELAFTPHAQYASRRGDAVFDDFLKKQLKSNVWDAGYYSAAESLYPILLAAVLVFFPEGEMGRMALLAVLIDLIQKSISPIKEVAGKISSIQRARTGLDRIMEFHQHFAGTQELRRSLLEMNSSLEVKVEHFSYQRTDESAFELNDISFKAQAGELVGIVGMSGCGKSTLLRLLSGQYGSFKGSVLVDGTHTLEAQDEQDLGQLCQLVSLVSQDSHVFSSSVEFNIALDLNVTGFQEFWQNALKALPYLGRWEIHPDTPVDVKTLSLGQKQLLSGLRACFLRKPIVLFDEVSSGLDPDLEKALRDLVLIVQRHSLTIIVTHRLETILSATKLLVMKEGRLMDTGSPRELMQSSEIFREFIEHLEK